MARVKNLDQITGNVGKLSFYTRKGSDEIFVRTKGGASKEKIKRDPAFANLRKANKEFGGCSRMSKQIRMTFYGLEHVAEFNLAPALSALAKNIQKTDTENPMGTRTICLSKYRYLLAGFDFGRTTRFNSLLRVPLAYRIDRGQQLAMVDIPEFACSYGLNLSQHKSYGQFRITAALGIATDMVLNPNNMTYEPAHDKLGQGSTIQSTPWYATQTTVPAQQLTLSLLPDQVQDHEAFVPEFTDADTLVLTVIVEFGAPDAFGNTMPVRGAGGGMVLGSE
jgi:hypothetical protein